MDKFIKEINKIGQEAWYDEEDLIEEDITVVAQLKEYLQKKLDYLNKFYDDDKVNWQKGKPTGKEFLVIRGNEFVEFLDFNNIVVKEKKNVVKGKQK